VKEPENLISFQIVAKTKNCLEKKYNDHQFPLFLFRSLPIFTIRLKIEREREKRERGRLNVAQGESGSAEEAPNLQIHPSLKQLPEAKISS